MYTKEIIDFREVSIWEGMTGETTENTATSKGTGCEDVVYYFTGWLGFTQKDNTFLGEESVKEDNNWVGIGTICSKVWVESKGLRALRVRGGKCGNELD